MLRCYYLLISITANSAFVVRSEIAKLSKSNVINKNSVLYGVIIEAHLESFQTSMIKTFFKNK